MENHLCLHSKGTKPIEEDYAKKMFLKQCLRIYLCFIRHFLYIITQPFFGGWLEWLLTSKSKPSLYIKQDHYCCKQARDVKKITL